MKILRLFLTLPLLAANIRAADAAVNELVLPEQSFPQLGAILQQAVQQSPRMLNRALDLEIAENSRIAARAALLPSFSASVSYYKSDDRSSYIYTDQSSSANSYRVTKTPYSATLTQPLFHWNERRNIARVGEIQQKISQGQYRDGYRLLAQELRTAYLRLIVQKLGVKRARFFLEFTNNQLKQQEERWAKKIISDADISGIRLSAERAHIAMEQTEFDYQMAKESFARLAGMSALEDDAIPDSIPVAVHPAGSFERLLAGFLSQKDPPSTEAATLRRQLEVESLNYANTKTRLRPKVNAVVGVSQDQQNNLYGTIDSYSLTSVYAGVSVYWNIFDGFATGAAVRNSLARRRQMENDYKALTERLAQQAQNQATHAGFSARNMSIADRLLVNSEGSLKTVQEDFQRGTKSEADVSQFRLHLFDAQHNAYSARLDYLWRTGEFLGTIMEDPVLANLADQ